MTESTMNRANRVSINTTENGFEAKFFKTHSLVLTIDSKDTAWSPDEKMNKTAQREAFRVWVCDNSTAYGVQWIPDDLRIESNRRIPKYTSDQVLLEDATEFIGYDIAKFWNDSKFNDNSDLTYGLTGDCITPVTMSAKGKDVEPKYGNGNWAWAKVDVLLTVKFREEEVYVTMTCELVSGQLKKPSGIDGNAYSTNGFATAVNKELNGLDAYKASLPVVDNKRTIPVEEEHPGTQPTDKDYTGTTGEDIRSEVIANREKKSTTKSKSSKKSTKKGTTK